MGNPSLTSIRSSDGNTPWGLADSPSLVEQDHALTRRDAAREELPTRIFLLRSRDVQVNGGSVEYAQVYQKRG
jgi:hypothetical protein